MAYFLKNNNDDQTQSGNQNQISGGNMYSTSGSEVSSTPTSTGSNNSSNSQSNESGNWVNLNKYLDANQGKVSGYVDKLVSPYTSRVEDYKSSLDNNKQLYNQDINNNGAVKTDKEKSANIITNYGKNTNSISDDDWKNLQSVLGGYSGPSQYALTGDQYGYLSDKKTADDFSNLGSNFENQDYRMSLMDKNVSSGGKKLNNFLLGASSDAQNKIKDYASQFKDLAALLDQNEAELNSVYDNALAVSEQNQNDALENLSKIEQYLRNDLTDKYQTQKQAAINEKNNLNNAVEKRNPSKVLIGSGIPISSDLYKTNTYDTMSKVAEGNYTRELQELSDRINSIKDNARMEGSTLDSDFDFGGWTLTPKQREQQIQRYNKVGKLTDQAVLNKDYGTVYSLLDVNNYSPEALKAKDLRARYIQGKITDDQYRNELGLIVYGDRIKVLQTLTKASDINLLNHILKGDF